MFLPPGFRFHPTDVELVMYYLKRKVLGKKFQFEAISEVNIYKFSPRDLPDKACLKSKDLEWYYFCPRERKYASGARMNRATETGYWKATGKDRAVLYNGKTVGMVKTLVFHQGHAPHGERTDWNIHEYRLQDEQLADSGIAQDAYVLCKFYQKKGPGPKIGAQYGAPFNEEEWEDAEDCHETLPSGAATNALVLPVNSSCSVLTTQRCPDITSSQTLPETVPYFSGAPKNSDVLDDDIIHLLASFTEENIPSLHHNHNNEMLDNDNHEGNISNVPSSDRNGFYYGLGDLGNFPELGDGGISFTATQDAGYVPDAMPYPDAYMELNDLEIPLTSSAVVDGSEHMQTSTNFNAPYYLSNVEGLQHQVNPFGMNENYSGSSGLPSLPGSSDGVGFASEMHQVGGNETYTNQLYDSSYRLMLTEPDESREINDACDWTSSNQMYDDAFGLAFTQPDAGRGIDQNHGRGSFVTSDVNCSHRSKT